MALSVRSGLEWRRPERAADDAEFWRQWLRQAGPLLGAGCTMLVRPPRGAEPMRVVMRQGEQTRPVPEAAVAEVLRGEEPLVLETLAGGGGRFVMRLPWDADEPASLVVVGEMPVAAWPTGPDEGWRARALLWATAVGRRQRGREVARLRGRADELAGTLELLGALRGRERFAVAALELCNRLAEQHGADRVALGWWHEPYIKLRAVSQMNQIEAGMTAVGELESAMEEAVEQGVTVRWPAPEEASEVSAQHAALARSQGWKHLCTVSMEVGERTVGAVTWHREATPFTADEAEGFALVVEAVAPELERQWRREGWWGRRLKRGIEEAARRHWNLQHPWWKLAAVLGAAAVAASLLIHVPYRVEAEFRLRPERQVVFAAPFEGFLAEVAVSPGELVAEGAPLFTLDATALRLEEGELLADLSRFLREREQAEAAREPAAMRVAEAQREQVAARLARLRRQIEQTTVRAPFAGRVLDDGNLRERLGAPLRTGDALLRFAPPEGLFFELAVPEADVALLVPGGPVELAFRGRPGEPQAAVVTRIEPEAVIREGGAVFLVRATATGETPAWWRPGMTGIAKLDTAERSLADIFTRRLRDWLRLRLWW